MKKIILSAALVLFTILGASAEDWGKTYFNGATNVRLGYSMPVNASGSHLTGGFDLGLNLLEFGVRPYDNGAVSLGVDFMLDTFNAEEGYYFLSSAHKTAIIPSVLDIKASRTEHLAFAIPLDFTHNFGNDLRISLGAAAKINLNSDTYMRYINATKDHCTSSVSGIYTNRLTWDVHMAVTYQEFGIYASYSPMKVYPESNGPSFNYLSVGVILKNL